MRQPVPFGKYLLLDRISVGGMAEVFKAKSYGVEGFEKIIAIKRILPTMGEDRDFIKMFIDEAKIAGQLAHANICQIFELGRIDGSHFIAMEYIWGKDLLQIQNRLRKIKQPMPIPMACFAIAKVLEGLDYAHRKRDPLGRPLEIVHRDCSPQNVLVSYEGEVKVIDFGIAKATSRNSRTMAGVLKGKFGYMSPEQVRGLPLDRRSDIFAIGTMLYECLTGDRLFQGETDFSTLEKVRNVDIRPPREINPNIPEAIEKVILKALAKDVDDRYQWCSEMLADLQQHLMGQDVVFTAKSLSGWLKEVFASEIDRERQQLEQYKRVGRDGLIAGVPAAAAKVDLVETLGEAGLPESDATQLGGPNFDDLEDAVAAQASPEVGPALGSPASRPPQAQAAAEDDDAEFGEEAPTEIFGDAEAAHVMGQVAAAKQPAAPPARGSTPPAASPTSRPPKPPPRPATSANQPVAYAAEPSGLSGGVRAATNPPPMAPISNPNAATMMADSDAARQGAAQAREAYAQNFPHLAHGSHQPAQGYVPVPHTPGPQPAVLAQGTPGAMQVQPLNALAPPGQPAGQGKTLMGAAPPPGVPNYGQGYPSHVSGQQAAASGPYGYPSQPQIPYGQPQMPHGQMQTGPMAGYAQKPYGMGGYPAEPTMPIPDGKRRSSIARDVAIGVAIAAIVLGGFLAVKFFVLDKPEEPPAPSGSTIATLRLAMPEGISAELYVDEKKVATVSKGHEIPVNAGLRKVKLLGPSGARCEQDMQLAAGKVTTVECIMHAGSAGSAGSAPVPAGSAGSADNVGVGSADKAAAGSGDKATDTTDKAAADKAAADKAAADKAAADKAAADKAAADKAAADKAAADKVVADKAAADKAAANKATADKATADKAAADKAAADKAAKAAADKAAKAAAAKDKVRTGTKTTREKPPVEEDNPIDRAAELPSKGYVKIVPPAGATILVDGAAPSGSTSKLGLVPGKHKVTFVLGADKHTFTVLIKAGETVTLDKKDLQ